MYKRVKYNFKEDIKTAIVAVFWIAVVISFIVLVLSAIDHIDRHTEMATVISIQRLDRAIVKVETADGNLWEFEADLQDNIDIGDTVQVTFKEYENDIREDDEIVNYSIIEE